jgi:hypothetical protein
MIGAGAVVLSLVVAGAVVLALRSGSETVGFDTPAAPPLPADGSAVIHDLRAPGGLALFGLQIVDPTHTVEVQFLTGPGCSTLVSSDDPWPAPYPECAGGPDITGVVSSLGVTDTGQSLVGVTFPVSGECHEQLRTGMTWPPGIPECGS